MPLFKMQKYDSLMTLSDVTRESIQRSKCFLSSRGSMK